MEGDITRAFRLNPRTQLAIDEYKKKRLTLNPTYRYEKEVTINKLVNEMLQDVGSEKWLEQEDVIMRSEALGRRVSNLEKVIKKHSRNMWDINDEIRRIFDNDYEGYLWTEWGVLE